MIYQILPTWRRCKTMKRDGALRCPPHALWVPCSFSDWLSSNSCAQNLCYKCLPIKFIPALYWLVLKFFSKMKSKFTWAEVFQTHSWLTPGAVVRMVETTDAPEGTDLYLTGPFLSSWRRKLNQELKWGVRKEMLERKVWVTHRGGLPASPTNSLSLQETAKKPSETVSSALVRKVKPGIL